MPKDKTTGLLAWIIPTVKALLVAFLILSGGVPFPFEATDMRALLSTFETLAVIVTLWWPGIGVIMSLPILVAAPQFSSTALGVVLAATTAVMGSIRWRPRAVLALGAIQAAFVMYDFVIVRAPGRTSGFVVMLLACYAVGLWIRAWLGNQVQGAHHLEDLKRRAARAREEERSSLASELAFLLIRSLNDTNRALDRAAKDPDPANAARILSRVGTEARTALARLRLLVTTLRAPASGTDAVSLAAAVEWFEDELVSHGFEVEIESELALDDIEVPGSLTTFLTTGAEAVVQSAPAGATCTIELTGGDPIVARLTCPGAAPLSMTAAAVGNTDEPAEAVTQSTDSWSVAAELSPQESGEASQVDGFTSMAQDRQVIAALSAAGVVFTLVLLGFDVLGGWPAASHAQWLLLSLGLLVAVWRPWIGAIILFAEAAIVAPLFPVDSLWFFTQPVLAASALTVILLARTLWTLPIVAAGWFALVAFTTWETELQLPDTIPLALPSLLLGVGVYFFRTVRSRQQAEAQRLEVQREDARGEERRQLASELHDIVAHQLSLIAMHLTPATMEPDRIQATIAQLRRTTESARNDLTALVHSLRSGQEGDSGTHSTKTTVQSVTATLEQADHPVRLTLSADVDRLDATSQKTLSRVVREAATNAMRYSPKGSPVDIDVAVDGPAATARIVNQLPTQARVDPHSTRAGLLGLRERVELTNGTFSAGEVDAHWVVEAHIPVTRAG